MVQGLIVALIVIAAFAYAAWTLVPPLRRWLGAGRIRSAGACGGCDGCGSAHGTPAAPREQPIRLVRRSGTGGDPATR